MIMDVAFELKDELHRRGASLVGFADLKGISPEAGMPFGISIAYALDPDVISQISDGPTGEYAALYHRANEILGKLAEFAADFIASRGWKAKYIPATTNVSADRLVTPLPHKTVATRAGLGWIGKCALLVTEQYGSALRLASVLTEMALPSGEPVGSSRCGSCDSCVSACPVLAPSGREWNPSLKREEFFDAGLCYEKTSENARRPEIGATICGICIAACPWTKRYLRSKNRES